MSHATRAIILAAGAGRRLGLDGPKSMTRVGDASIIQRQLKAFRAAGVSDFVIVVGFESDTVRRHLTGEPGRFVFIDNPVYASTNTIYSLYLARQHFADGFFYANADVVFDRRLPMRLQESAARNALAVFTSRCAEEEVKVVVANNRVMQIGKNLNPEECLGEFVGVARFSSDIAADFCATLERLVEHEGVVQDYFELALNDLCARQRLDPIGIDDLPCREIDFPEDLSDARERLLPLLCD